MERKETLTRMQIVDALPEMDATLEMIERSLTNLSATFKALASNVDDSYEQPYGKLMDLADTMRKLAGQVEDSTIEIHDLEEELFQMEADAEVAP